MKKNWLKFWKNRPVWFGIGFISLEPNRTEKKQKKTESKQNKTEKNQAKLKKNCVKPEKTEPNLNRLVWTGFCSKITETGRFEPVPVWFGYFFYKNRTEPKMITPNQYHINKYLKDMILYQFPKGREYQQL